MWTKSGLKTEEHMLVLFKFGQKSHLESLRQLGQIHMRTLRYFAAEERANTARSDRFEGAATIIQPAHLQMSISHPVLGTINVDPNDVVGPVILSYNVQAEQNVFCMFSITEPKPRPLFDKRYLSFGDHFVMVTNAQEFLNRVTKALSSLRLESRAGLVEYFEEMTYSGKIGSFRKPANFAYQREFRIVVSPGISPSRDLLIGDISDITTPVLPLLDIDRIVDFTEEAAISAGWFKS